MSKVEDKAVELLDKMDALLTQYTPEVMDAAVSAVQVSAIGELAFGLIGVASAFLLFLITNKLAVFCRRKSHEDGVCSDWDYGLISSLTVGVAATSVIALISAYRLFDIWNWVALYNPELALAHKVLGL